MVDETACVLAFSDDLAYWAIDELYMEPCCQQRYQQRKEQVLEVLKKELEDLTLGDETDAEAEQQHSTLADTAEEQCVVRWRRTVWDLTEKPQSSLPARVSTNVNKKNAKSFPSHKAHRAALISVSLALSIHQFTLTDHGYGSSASRGVPVHVPAFANSLILIAPTRGGIARLS